MKTIGLIGGISWESTAEYYRILNQEINQRLGGRHSARIRMYSFDFDEIYNFNQKNDFDSIRNRLIEEAIKLEKAGSELLLLCANTAHKWAKDVKDSITIPIIHIAEATGQAITDAGIRKVALLGTKLTMEGDFIKGKLSSDYGIEVTVPEPEDQEIVSSIIYDELIIGEFNEPSRNKILNVINGFEDIEGVILGCTELPLIIKPEDITLQLFNTTELHAQAAIDFALS
ncbi:MAG: aspartate/glutamate racemase family protein [Bacteroidales bacterium]|nr:aspartate/glutamate racemase family protein [Bacteroidales bacterium]